MESIFTLKNILIYLVLINLISFLAMFIDKRKAKKGKWRTPEKTLFILCLIGGSIGGICGMYVFRHKTKKMRFIIGFPLILIVQIICVILILLTQRQTY